MIYLTAFTPRLCAVTNIQSAAREAEESITLVPESKSIFIFHVDLTIETSLPRCITLLMIIDMIKPKRKPPIASVT